MGVMQNLSGEQMEALLEHEHPLDHEAEKVAAQGARVSPKRVSMLLSLFDNCFHDQDPSNYRHGWSSLEHVGFRMYRHVTAEQFEKLVDVAEAAHDVNLMFRSMNVIMSAHMKFLGDHAQTNPPELGFVVHHPDLSERTEI